MISSSQEFKNSILRWLSLILTVLLVVIFNDGFMGTDEYWTSIVHYLPAQNVQLSQIVSIDDVKSPLQNLPFFALAQLALKLGLTHPYHQYRFVLAALSLFNLCFVIWVALFFEKKQSKDQSFNFFNYRIGIPILFTLYFAMPFTLTRAMYESVTAPWLFAYAIFTVLSLQKKNYGYLFLAVTFGSVAFMLRPQVGLCSLALPILLIEKKRIKEFLFVSLAGLFYFILSGWLDSLWRGEFHYSLKAVTIYNWQHGAEYGSSPWWTYIALIFVMMWGPFLIRKYSKEFWTEYFTATKVYWLIIALFVFIHSLFSQKFERFLICLIPIVCLVLWPFLVQLYRLKAFKTLGALGLLNLIVWFTVSFFPPQKNIIDLALYLDQHPEIKTVYSFNDSVTWIPELFIKNNQAAIVPKTLSEISEVELNCQSVGVINDHYRAQVSILPEGWDQLSQFKTNWIEQISYKLNQKHNVRRATLSLYGKCKSH